MTLKILLYISLTLLASLIILRWYISSKRAASKQNNNNKTKVAFLHPFCNDAGGGQKVLWCMVKALTDSHQNIEVAIYSLQPDLIKMLEKIKTRFTIIIDQSKVKIIHVTGQKLLQPTSFLTMLMHIFLPCVYAFKCFLAYQPDVFFDTTGYIFTMWVAKLLSPTTLRLAYIHYPFISQQMLNKVRERRQDFNNKGLVAKIPILGKLKLVYYVVMLRLYKSVQNTLDFAFANSSWTLSHLSLPADKIKKLFPPCNISRLLDIEKPNNNNIIMSFSQFRPEKRQELQLRVFKKIKDNNKQLTSLKFYMVGTTRGPGDQQLLSGLKNKTKQLQLQNDVVFYINCEFSKITEIFKQASHGIHTMQSEHFGISVVEMMAAGLIVVAHDSAGPKIDIIHQGTGYRAESEEDYVMKLETALRLNNQERRRLIEQARKRVVQFSDQSFIKIFNEDFQSILNKKQKSF